VAVRSHVHRSSVISLVILGATIDDTDDMNMAKDMQTLPELQCDSKPECDREVDANWENETDFCLSKNANSNSLNAESEPPQPDVHFSNGSGKSSVTSLHDMAVAEQSDGGWGWVIVLGAFFTTFILGGITYSFSLFYLEFVELFGASRAVIGWIGSLHMFMSNVLGMTNDCC